MKELLIRASTGLVFVLVLIGAIVLNKYSVAGLFFVVSMLGLIEFFQLMEKAGFKPKKRIAATIGGLIYGIIALYSFGGEITFSYLLFIFPLLVILVLLELFRKSEFPVTNFAFSIAGILYVVIPFAMLNFFAYRADGRFYETIGIEGYQYILLLAFFVIQWSNDIYLEGKKLSGMLIENKWSGNKCTAIIGIGINVNQVDFADLNATSIQVTNGQEYDIKLVLSKLVSNLEMNFLKLRNGSIKSIEKEYLENLLFFEECRSYRKPDGSEFEGIIKDVLNTGHLVIDSKGKSHLFSFKEVFPMI